ncbi:MAG: molybdopterin-synthase adenylyltransferase MoeB [Rhizobiaceae bacterium]|nr:molybdopterin-synthase adenylyltransferase MoeB [Rhizobiaceae bacterium]
MTDKKPQDEKLNSKELERYARHIVLRDVGGVGQQKLKSARVLVIGAGGLGSSVLQYLAAAGVGTLGIVDDDTVSLSNLQRQIIHNTSQVGIRKTQSAAAAIARINPHTKTQQWPVRLSAQNAYGLFSQYDIIADGSDNFDTRFLAADTCELLRIPLVSAAVGQFDGSLTTLKPFENDENDKPNPALRDIFPVKPQPGSLPTCEEAGVMGALTGILGTMQAHEVIKEIVGFGENLVGRLLMIDAKSMRFETISYTRSPR